VRVSVDVQRMSVSAFRGGKLQKVRWREKQ